MFINFDDKSVHLVQDSPATISYEQPNLVQIESSNIIPKRRCNRGVSKSNVHSYYRLAITSTTLPPKNYDSILLRPGKDLWLEVYQREIDKLEQTGEMKVVPRPSNKRVIPILELLTTKKDNITNSWKAKCRIVARGDLEFAFGDFYAPVANCVAFRLFLSLSTKFQSRIHQLDVTSAFLYGKLSDPIFIELPKGHPQKAGRSKVWFTHTAIYGLVEAPKVWNSTIHQFLVDWGLRSLYSETCLYVRNEGGKYDEATMLLLLYVDDVLYVGIDSVISAFEDAIRHRFKIKTKT